MTKSSKIFGILFLIIFFLYTYSHGQYIAMYIMVGILCAYAYFYRRHTKFLKKLYKVGVRTKAKISSEVFEIISYTSYPFFTLKTGILRVNYIFFIGNKKYKKSNDILKNIFNFNIEEINKKIQKNEKVEIDIIYMSENPNINMPLILIENRLRTKNK